jgi:(p)ppGpp synthase/HD superfamily hydrolase
LDETFLTLSDLQNLFDPDIVSVVLVSSTKYPQNNLKSLLKAMCEDGRVTVIELALRLHDLRVLDDTDWLVRRRMARETSAIFVPVARRLGLWNVQNELGNLALHIRDPDAYDRIEQYLAYTYGLYANEISAAVTKLRAIFPDACVKSRFKSPHSISTKMMRFKIGMEEVRDFCAMRIVIKGKKRAGDAEDINILECYRALSIVHALWRPVTGSFFDYIASPKPNGYRSIHTTVLLSDKLPLEVQIRTERMHRIAEHGSAAHWKYKNPMLQNNLDTLELRLTIGIRSIDRSGLLLDLSNAITARVNRIDRVRSRTFRSVATFRFRVQGTRQQISDASDAVACVSGVFSVFEQS